MDCIFIEGLKIDCIIGIYDYEQQKEQPLVLDCKIYYDNHSAGLDDDYSKVIDYALVCQDIEHLLKSSRFALVETAGEEIAKLILNKYRAQRLELKINKPQALPQASGVGIIISRGIKDD